MKQKITISAILRRSLLVICAVFCFWIVFACSEDSSSLPSLSGIYAPDVAVVYDGRPHSVSVKNTLPTDTITYSLDNISFSSSSPSFTDVGSYTVYFKVSRSGYADFSSSATVSVSPCVLSDISAPDLSFVYNGLSHPPVISGTLPSDVITFSSDGVSFSSSPPSFTDVGIYTVYYCVSRPYGEYRSSCSVTILPNIYGSYFNPDHGVIVISSDVSFSVLGEGFLDNIPFSVKDNVLTYNSVAYSLLSDEDFIYRLNDSVYFTSSASGYLSVSFKDNIAEIKLGDSVLLSLPDFNFCESGVISDYSALSFTQAFSSSSVITDVSVELSLRPVNPVTVDTVYYTYDGLEHTFDFSSDEVIFLDDVISFTDVGSYTVPVVFTSSVYLPKLLDCTLVILPDVSGVFLSSDHVIHISDGNVFIDGFLCGELTVDEDTWACNDLPIVATDTGIQYDGVVYSSTDSPVLVVYVDEAYCSCFPIVSDTLYIRITYDGSVLSFVDDKDVLLLSFPLSCADLSVSLDGDPLVPLAPASFSIGYSDLSSPVIVVWITTS